MNTAIDLPPDESFAALWCVAHGRRLLIDDDGRMAFELHDGRTVEVTDAELDPLIKREWVAFTDRNQIIPTAKGRYWLKRWQRSPSRG